MFTKSFCLNYAEKHWCIIENVGKWESMYFLEEDVIIRSMRRLFKRIDFVEYYALNIFNLHEKCMAHQKNLIVHLIVIYFTFIWFWYFNTNLVTVEFLV